MNIEQIKYSYILCNMDRDFAVGPRENLKYACECRYTSLIELNTGGIDPFEYLNFAKYDILSNDARGAINGLSNAKKAIHLIINCFLQIMGIYTAYKKSTFPQKLDVIKKLEAFPINIISNLNKKRNYIEHDYKTLSVDEAIDFVDVTEMFLRLCYPFLKHTVVGICVGLKNDKRDICWLLDPEKSQINIYENSNSKFFRSCIGIIYYNHDIFNNPQRHLMTININNGNVDTWLPYLNTFVYCTKKAIIPKNPPCPLNHSERLAFFQGSPFFIES